jgi:membrane protein
VTGGASWRRVLSFTVRDLRAANAAEWAAALACYALLSTFPLLLAGVALASLVTDGAWAAERVGALLDAMLPQGELNFGEAVAAAVTERRRIGFLSAVLFLVTGRRVLGALTKALNAVSDIDNRLDPPKRRFLVELALLFGLAAMLLLALVSGPLVELAWATAKFAPLPDGAAYWVIREISRSLLLLVIFGAVFAVVPRGRRDRRSVAIGAITATVLLMVARVGFELAIDLVWPNVRLAYGPLAVAALLLVWAWYVALITLIGAAVASQIQIMLTDRRARPE